MEHYSREQIMKSLDTPLTTEGKTNWMEDTSILDDEESFSKNIVSFMTIQDKCQVADIYNERIKNAREEFNQGMDPEERELQLHDIQFYSKRKEYLEKQIDADIITAHRNGVVESYLPQNIDLFIGDNYTTSLLGTKEYIKYVTSNVSECHQNSGFKLVESNVHDENGQFTLEINGVANSFDDYLSVEHYIGSLKDALLSRLDIHNIVWSVVGPVYQHNTVQLTITCSERD